jgi:myo-inositol 2-dehydrogenase/D-chiro-inositol 1-dehydrogenase
MRRYRIGVIGYGRIGPGHARFISENPRYELAWICDADASRQETAQSQHPGVRFSTSTDDVFSDGSLDAIAILTRRDVRPGLIRKALAAGLHVSAEKPLGSGAEDEPALLTDIEKSDRIVAVNLFNRNAWYHNEARALVRKGEIGKLAAVRVCHMFPGPLPTRGEDCPDPPATDCAMHYLDIARWYVGSEYDEWSARGACVWGEPPERPWYFTVNGCFENNVLFEITNSYAYANGSRERRNCSYTDLVGTHGATHIQVDAWGDATLDAYGINETVHLRKPYGDKYYDVFYERFAHAMDTGDYGGLATARDAVTASLLSYRMHECAVEAGPRAVGTWDDLEDVRKRRLLRDGRIG